MLELSRAIGLCSAAVSDVMDLGMHLKMVVDRPSSAAPRSKERLMMACIRGTKRGPIISYTTAGTVSLPGEEHGHIFCSASRTKSSLSGRNNSGKAACTLGGIGRLRK